MKREIKAKWVKALRSGEYKQGREALSNRTDEGGREYCCLGVLCELAVQEGVIPPPDTMGLRGIKFLYDGADDHYLPEKVATWAGLSDNDPYIGDSETAAHWNDHGKSFDEIADAIERNL